MDEHLQSTPTHPISIAAAYIDQTSLLETVPWLSTRKLADWRRNGLKFFTGKEGVAVYRVSDIENRIEEGMNQCEEGSNTAVDGSARSKEAPSGMKTGTTKPDEEHIAEALEQSILSIPKHS